MDLAWIGSSWCSGSNPIITVATSTCFCRMCKVRADKDPYTLLQKLQSYCSYVFAWSPSLHKIRQHSKHQKTRERKIVNLTLSKVFHRLCYNFAVPFLEKNPYNVACSAAIAAQQLLLRYSPLPHHWRLSQHQNCYGGVRNQRISDVWVSCKDNRFLGHQENCKLLDILNWVFSACLKDDSSSSKITALTLVVSL